MANKVKVVDQGKLTFLAALIAQWGNNVYIHLFKNNHVPADSDTLADYVIADYDGYGILQTHSWTVPLLVANRGLTQAAPLVFLCTGNTTPNDIYGYFAFDILAFELRWAKRFDAAPVVMAQSGDSITINPVFTTASES